jgi:hypothetical protein
MFIDLISSFMGSFVLSLILMTAYKSALLKVYLKRKAIWLSFVSTLVTYFFLSFILSKPDNYFVPYIIASILILIYNLNTMKTQCPYCKENIKEDAVICKHCRSHLRESLTS